MPQRLIIDAESTGKGGVLIRLSYILGRKDQQLQVLWQEFQGPRQNSGIDRRIDADRQMWSVLFNRTDRQHGDRASRIEAGELLRRQIPPVTRNHTAAARRAASSPLAIFPVGVIGSSVTTRTRNAEIS